MREEALQQNSGKMKGARGRARERSGTSIAVDRHKIREMTFLGGDSAHSR